MKKHTKNIYVLIIGINVIMFLLQMMLGSDFTKNLTLNPTMITTKPWTLITSMFLHGSFAHLLFNMYALLIFGGLIEQKIGTKRFITIYLSAGIFAGLIYSIFSTTPALGASGAIMAILGLTIILLPHMQVLFFFIIPMSMRTAGIIFAAIDVFGLFNPTSGIAHTAHLAGLAVGLIYGYYLIKKRKKIQTIITNIKPKKHKPKKNTIELSDEDIEEYIRNGKL